MERTYLDGKVRLKEPTFKNLIKIGQLLDEYESIEVIGGEASIELVKSLCDIEEGFDLEKFTPAVVVEIVEDFLREYVKELNKR